MHLSKERRTLILALFLFLTGSETAFNPNKVSHHQLNIIQFKHLELACAIIKPTGWFHNANFSFFLLKKCSVSFIVYLFVYLFLEIGILVHPKRSRKALWLETATWIQPTHTHTFLKLSLWEPSFDLIINLATEHYRNLTLILTSVTIRKHFGSTCCCFCCCFII